MLIALGEVLRQGREATLEGLGQIASQYDLDSQVLQKELREFINRQVFTESNGVYSYYVPLFQKWLKAKGVNEVLTSIDAAEYVVQHQKQRDELFVKAAEIHRLTSSWSAYKGKKVSSEDVRAWLEQFNGYEEQRMMFDLISHIKFVSEVTVRERLRDARKSVQKDLRIDLSSGDRKSKEILVSYLDGEAKSGAHYARLFAKESSIYAGNVIAPGSIKGRLVKDANIKSLTFIDDFVGTGNTLLKGLTNLDLRTDVEGFQEGLPISIVALVGFQTAKDMLLAKAEDLGLNLTVHLCETLDESDRCFSEHSVVFSDTFQKDKAKDIVRNYGLRLYKKHPLGHNDSEALVVFSDTCPNNSLPIIWSSTDWIPLFER